MRGVAWIERTAKSGNHNPDPIIQTCEGCGEADPDLVSLNPGYGPYPYFGGGFCAVGLGCGAALRRFPQGSDFAFCSGILAMPAL